MEESQKIKKIGWYFVAFLILFTFANNTIVAPSSDNFWTIPTSKSLIKELNLDLNEYPDLLSFPYAKHEQNGKYYNNYPYGTAIIISPLVFILDKMGYQTTTYQGIYETNKLIASILVAISCLITLATFINEGLILAIILTLLYFFATPALTTGAVELWQHTTLLPIYAFVIFVLHKNLYKQNRYLLTSYGFLYFSFLVRPLAAIPIFFLSLYLLIKDKKAFLKTIPIGIIILFLSCWYSFSIYGTFLSPYYHYALGTSLRTFLEAFAGNLVSPARGILIHSPFLVFGIFGLIYLFKQKNYLLLITIVLISLTHLIMISRQTQWWAGVCFGARFFTDLIPFLIILVFFGLKYIKELKNKTKKTTLLIIFSILVLFSVYVHIKGAYSMESVIWGNQPYGLDNYPEKIWDFSDAAFLH